MPYHFSRLIAFLALTCTLPLSSLSADEKCQVFTSKDIDPFEKVVKRAELVEGNRRSFVFGDHRWFIEEKVYLFITQEGLTKHQKYSINSIENPEHDHDVVGKKLRCNYVAIYVLDYDNENVPREYPFRMTRIIRK